MSTALLQNVDQLLARSNEPLNLIAHQETIQQRALEDIQLNEIDALLAKDPGNPLLIKEEAAALKEYFRKLKFAHLEQEAKRFFIYSITGDEPQGVSEEDNLRAEGENAVKKAKLKALKGDIEGMQIKAVEIARSNTKKEAALSERISEAQTLHKQIKEMELEMQRMRAAHPTDNRMTTEQAQDLVDQYEQTMIQMTADTDDAKKETEIIRSKAAKAAKDIQRLAKDREREEARAKEVREGREAGDTRVDDLCHWLSSSITFYKTLLGIQTVTAISETTIQLEYDNIAGTSNPVTLLLEYDPTSRRLIDARLLGTNMDIQESTDLAIASNDVPGLVADIMNRLRR